METNRRDAEMRRRREEQRRMAQRRSQEKNRKKKQNKSVVLIAMLCLLLVGALIMAAFTVLFPVKTLVVEGTSRYSAQQIVEAAGIEEGQNLLRLSPAATERNIRAACPYICDVTLKRKLPSKAIITVTEETNVLAFPCADGFWLTTSQLETIELVAEVEKATIVYGITISGTTGGQPVTFENEEQKKQLEQLLSALQTEQIDQITKIDMTDPLAVRLQYGEQHIWKLGDLSNLNYKLQFGREISLKEGNTGTVDLSGLNSGKNGYFKCEVLEEFMPTEPTDVTPTDLSDVTQTDLTEDSEADSE